ncbi:MAG TPA: thioredoxin domain-containing protein, partial [Thermodesulfobacteriota bacterium]|nr:thioredoxin domain-containing protein [Thermodesulfobacteriota bacterium]
MDEQQETRTRGTNRLGAAKSPYLLQHASNPVDWYPWEDEAFQRARTEEKPIFLSIGYATCHWCHVMAHESFEDEEVAALLNKHFVAIKVDREERPDIDHIYMSVCQAITGSGGWPLSVFMTPEAKPFFAGTYFPKHGRKGMPGFVQILTQLAAMWERDRARLLESSDTIVKAVQPAEQNEEADFGINMNMLRQCVEQFRRTFDTRWGGFGSAPKFPTPHNLSFLLRWYERTEYSSALQMAEKTLEGMRNGGIFDHIGFGFHRYSVDERWLVPHFEKMLYDQALLAIAYAEAWQVTGKDQYREVVHEIFSYVLRDMTSPEGGFYSAEDADSEGVEGLFYVWTPAEVKDILGKDRGDLFCRYFQITEEGNFEHG